MDHSHRKPSASPRADAVLTGSLLVLGAMGFALAFAGVFRARGLRRW